MPEMEVEFMRGRPCGFYTDLPHGLIYAHAGKGVADPPILFVPAEVVRRMPEQVADSLRQMRLVRIPVGKLEELVEQWTTKFTSRMEEAPMEEIERAFSEHCYLAVMPGHINVAMRNPREPVWGRRGEETVKVKMEVEQAFVEGRTIRFGTGAG